ncbi:MAG: hypothetical protein ACFBSG_12525 [Leptolyngbyaceae cyanobacterium]
MVSQLEQQHSTTQRQKIAVYDNLSAAQQAKEQLQQEGLSLNEVSIEGDINVYEEVAALGTVVGGEAGLLIGAFFGGTAGVIFVSIYSTLTYGDVVNSSFNQLAIIVLTIAGAVLGLIQGKRIRKDHLPEQKQKGNPDVPRRFQLIVEGDRDSIDKASKILRFSAAS